VHNLVRAYNLIMVYILLRKQTSLVYISVQKGQT